MKLSLLEAERLTRYIVENHDRLPDGIELETARGPRGEQHYVKPAQSDRASAWPKRQRLT